MMDRPVRPLVVRHRARRWRVRPLALDRRPWVAVPDATGEFFVKLIAAACAVALVTVGLVVFVRALL